MTKHWTQWTAADHAKHNAEDAKRRLEQARFNGFRTVAEYEAVMSRLYANLNAACDTKVF